MALHFSKSELAMRRQNSCDAMARDGLDGLLIFRQESMFYLTGYDTFGYVFFQCLYLSADGTMTLLTRAPDLRQARHTSMIDDIRVWPDAPDANPSDDLKAILDEHGCKGKRLGVEWESYGLTARNGQRLQASLDGFCTLTDASELVTKLRVVKSPAEIDYVRRAGQLGDDAWDAAIQVAAPGVSEGTVLAAMQGAVFEGGGDYPGNEFIVGSGRDALLCRYYSGRRDLDAQDQLTLEWAGVYRHYHAAMMRTMCFGKPPGRQLDLYAASRDALEAVREKMTPGNTYGDAFQAHADMLDSHGLSEHRLKACGYSLGTTFAPNWMDWPMMYERNPVVFEPGMVVFMHMIIADSDSELAMTLGETVLVTEGGNERLSSASLDLVVK
ncbi:MAG: aminopeptidase P family protein [Rhodospirillales bacterium]|jgi:Xaa-Pro dipeptidase|nr:aminopeptidase P family protein [Rhodospirillales bacterium]MBT4039912.1 aminopeptidase P family protein [Rhodospirillales bacterium]MBT4625913.1 aminopeptidase P family protein [Rhodospirillales bacterium]MBT5352349.1 aminopeptidase P family protein [Rhodospirillales bacterium]MBT5519795.1 aminopeptidase P family protein [Rhodospirillales bacterium]